MFHMKHVSCETSPHTQERLHLFANAIKAWSHTTSLVSRTTLPHLWSRHVEEGVALLPYAPTAPWLDIGTGAGFPGMVVAFLMEDPLFEEACPSLRDAKKELKGRPLVHLVESNPKKVAFLHHVKALTHARVVIHEERLQSLTLPPFPVITARAVADMSTLLEMAYPFATPDTLYLFPKGEKVKKELTQARIFWSMEEDIFPCANDSLLPPTQERRTCLVRLRQVHPIPPNQKEIP